MVGTENLSVGHHVVQFYGRDEELTETVTGYLLEGLQDGGAAVVIATEEHRRAFEDRLRQAGVDVTAAQDNGTYIAVDAAETLGSFTVAGQLEVAAFERIAGDLIRQAGAGSGARAGQRPVRAYGEMVALLWADGLVNEAVQLEARWDEFVRRRSFSVLCAYPVGSMGQDGYLDAFADVCRLHREVMGLWPACAPGPDVPGAVRTFPFTRDAPAAARHFAVDALRGWGAADFGDDVALVVTELAANAVVHAHSGFTVVLSVRGDVLRIAVRDSQPLPVTEPVSVLVPAPLHGLGAVDALARQWGVESLGAAGKTVWVELRR